MSISPKGRGNICYHPYDDAWYHPWEIKESPVNRQDSLIGMFPIPLLLIPESLQLLDDDIEIVGEGQLLSLIHI